MNCNIIQDLLSNYIDGLNSKETDEEVKRHLDECENCRIIYEKMSKGLPKEEGLSDNNIDFLKSIKKKLYKKNSIIGALVCIMVISGFIIFAKSYSVVLPFDINRMFVEEFQAAVVSDENGGVRWLDRNSKLYEDVIPEDCEETINLIRLSYKGINRLEENSRGRNIKRDGEDVWVVYYCYYKTLWNHWFYDGDLAEESESGSSFGSDIYGDGYQNINYEPQMREVYYLPMRDIYKIETLSDEEFDNLKNKAYLIWKGVV